MNSLVRRGLDSLFNPVVRLNTDFPLTGKKLGKTYAIGVVIFFAGSLLPVFTLIGGLWLLATYGDPTFALKLLNPVLNIDNGNLNHTAETALVAFTFCTGFGAQMWYFARVLKRSGQSLRVVIGLSTQSLRASNPWLTAWALVWRVAVAYGIWFGLDMLIEKTLPPVQQNTQDFSSSLSGGNMLLWFIVSAVLAPVFEEIVFRGFLFQALRATFHRWMEAAGGQTTIGEPVPSPSKKEVEGGLRRLLGVLVLPLGKLLRWVLSPFLRALIWATAPLGRVCSAAMQRCQSYIGRRVLNTPGRADLAAVTLSASVFAVEHMQFHPVTLLMLFLMGCFLAEVFRRTGSLWTGILLHALNNGVAVILLAHAH